MLFTTLIGLVLQVAAGQFVGPLAQAKWDQVTLDVEGKPETLASYELALVAPGQDLNVDGTPAIASQVVGVESWQGLALVDLLRLAGEVPSNFQVRAIDAAGNESDWSGPLPLVFDETPPKTPQGVEVYIFRVRK